VNSWCARTAGNNRRAIEFIRRFPQYAELLRRQFQLHEAIQSAPSTQHVSGKSTAGPAAAVEELRWPGFPELGNYTVQECIGRGGMGTVFRAVHRRMNRVVALKVLPPQLTKKQVAVERFQREVETAAQLTHPNIVTAYDADEAQGIHFLVMEYVEGTNLAEHVAGHAPLPLEDALNVVLQTAEGLSYAHERGIVHRDVKPANLIRDAAGTVRILDVGLARIHEALAPEDRPGDPLANPSLTQAGSFVGTIDFMAPEQSRDPRAVDLRADVYGLGCTLYFLLTGTPVYPLATVEARLRAHQSQDIPSLRRAGLDVPDRLDAALRRMLAKKPEDRFGSMREVITALVVCRKAKRRRRAGVIGVGAALLVVLLLLTAVALPRNDPSLPPQEQAAQQMAQFHALWKELRKEEAQRVLAETHALVESLSGDQPADQVRKATLYAELADAFDLTAQPLPFQECTERAGELLRSAIQQLDALDEDSKVAVLTTHRQLANLKNRQGNPIGAFPHVVDDYHTAHRLYVEEPENPVWKRQLCLSRLAQARMLLQLGRVDEADKMLGEAMQYDPANTEALHARLNVLYSQFDGPFNAGKWAEAWVPYHKRHQLLTDFIGSLGQPPQGQLKRLWEESFYYLGEMQWNLGNQPAALEHYEAALKLGPENSNANRGLVRCLLHFGDADRKAGKLVQSLEHFQRADKVQSYLVETYEKSLKDKQTLVQVLDRLKRLHDEMGNASEAQRSDERRRDLASTISPSKG
jgi:tetratricopeptide (TPR) repeat protein